MEAGRFDGTRAKFRSILLIGAASVAMGIAAPAAVFAADTAAKPAASSPPTMPPATTNSTPPSPVEQGAAKAGTNMQKAVGAQDTFTPEEAATVVALSSVDKSNATLMAAKVDDPQGNIVGTVKRVKTDKAGRVAAVHVDVGAFLGVGGRVVELPASKLSYLPSRNILFTSATKAEIEALRPVADNTAKDKPS
jgi:hypothetical protein